MANGVLRTRDDNENENESDEQRTTEKKLTSEDCPKTEDSYS